MSINSIKIKLRLGLIVLSLCSPLICFTSASANNSGLTVGQLLEYSANNIYFYRSCGNNNNFSSICGSTPREKYWSALRQFFDETHVAAIFGSIDHEGSFGPTLWQYSIVPAGSGNFKSGITWNQLFSCNGNSCPGGVGAFQITWSLGPYLQQINSNAFELIKYYQDPTYSLKGDQALEKIGEADYDKLVSQEIDFVLSSIDKKSFEATKTLEEATDWWTKYYENCANCCGSADVDNSCEQIEPRRASAQKEYDEMKDFTCSGNSSNSVPANTSQFTLLDGYGALTFYGPDAASNGGYAGQNATDSINGGKLADGQVAKDSRDGGLLQFGDIIYIETTPEESAETSYANGKFFIVADTGGQTFGSGKWDIDVFVDEPNPSALNYPPYGSTQDGAKIYKVASGVSWEEYLEKYYGKSSVNTSGSCSGSSTTGNAIADMALKLAYFVEQKGSMNPSVPKPEYLEAMRAVGLDYNSSGHGVGASCDQFVATVMRYTGADPNFNTSIADCSGGYMMEHPELYEEIPFNGSNFEILQPGDIFSTFAPSSTCDSGGHIYIYAELNGQRIRADASSGGRTAEYYYTDPVIHDHTSSRGERTYKVFRRK